MITNMPVHSPLYASDSATHLADDYEAIAVLLRVDDERIREVLSETPLKFVSPYAWLEIMTVRSSDLVEPYCGGGVIIPARYGEVTGGYYAYCYVDSDVSMAAGREAYGYPKKLAEFSFQRTGDVAAASVSRLDASFELSVIVDDNAPDPVAETDRFPHLLYQVLPNADRNSALLKRVISRDTSVGSKYAERSGIGSFGLPRSVKENELSWLRGAEPVAAVHMMGAFRGAAGSVLGVEYVSSDLCGIKE